MSHTYRKKPVEIQARQTGQDYDTDCEIAEWCGGTIPSSESLEGTDYLFYIYTLEGDMWVSSGDWVIQGVQGEFYPCKPDIFEATYEGPVG